MKSKEKLDGRAGRLEAFATASSSCPLLKTQRMTTQKREIDVRASAPHKMVEVRLN